MNEQPEIIAFAIPKELAERMRDSKPPMMWTRNIIDRGHSETIIEPSAIEFLKKQGYFFKLDEVKPAG